MKKRPITLPGLVLLALFSQVTQAQNLEDLVQRLVRQTDTLAQRSYDSFGSRRNPSRYDIEALYQSRSLNASAELFQRMSAIVAAIANCGTHLLYCKIFSGTQVAMRSTGAIGAISNVPATTWHGN